MTAVVSDNIGNGEVEWCGKGEESGLVSFLRKTVYVWARYIRYGRRPRWVYLTKGEAYVAPTIL